MHGLRFDCDIDSADRLSLTDFEGSRAIFSIVHTDGGLQISSVVVTRDDLLEIKQWIEDYLDD